MADTAAPAAPAPAASESAAPVVPPLVVSFRPSMVDKAVQAKSRVALAVSSQVSQSMEQGRATFRPPSSLQGRATFRPPSSLQGRATFRPPSSLEVNLHNSVN
ncbi:hypothetical protein T484DRAFT_1837199 [Baffinella frigidus]|nr:hypothetical protein T484DRAFT_1837199 [Cryptophyta sp. CCMP2293]